MFKKKSSRARTALAGVLVAALALSLKFLSIRDQVIAPTALAPEHSRARISSPVLLGDNSPVPQSSKKVSVLKEIISSGNDNDPRIDQLLDNLDTETKAEFRLIYLHLPPERRNSRGLIVLMLGHNLTDPEDFEFMKTVLAEEPCLSLESCHQKPNGLPGDGSPSEIVLNYPLAVALELLELAGKNPDLTREGKNQIQDTIKQGLNSKIPFVASKSRGILTQLKSETH